MTKRPILVKSSLLLPFLGMLANAQDTPRAAKSHSTEIAETVHSLQHPDKAFSDGMNALLNIARDPSSDRTTVILGVAKLLNDSHLGRADDETIVEQSLRFAYEKRASPDILLGPIALASFTRVAFGLNPAAYGKVCCRYLDDRDAEVQSVASQFLIGSGFLNIVVEEGGSKRFGALEDFISRSDDDKKKSLPVGLYRLVFSRDPELAYEAFSGLEVHSLTMTEREPEIVQRERSLVHYVAWSASQQETFVCAQLVPPAGEVLLRQLSTEPTRNSKLFVLGLMDEYRVHRRDSVANDVDLLQKMASDSDPIVKAIAGQILTEVSKK